MYSSGYFDSAIELLKYMQLYRRVYVRVYMFLEHVYTHYTRS